MTIDKTQQVMTQTLTTIQQTKAKTEEFATELERQLINSIKSQLPEAESVNEEVEVFREKLTSMGAVAFFQHFNMEKIEKMLEEKREELEAALGLDETTEPPLEGKERENALGALEEMMEAYAKQIKEQMAARKELEKEGSSPLQSLLA